MVRTMRGIVLLVLAVAFAGCFGRSPLAGSTADSSTAGHAAELGSSAGHGGAGGTGTKAGVSPSSSSGASHATNPLAPSIGGSGGRTSTASPGSDEDAGIGGDGNPEPVGSSAGAPAASDSGGADSGGAGGGGAGEGGADASDAGAGGSVVSPTVAELQQELTTRWNAIADTRPPPPPDPLWPPGHYFHWEIGDFPHPTFQLGTPEGYHEFAFVLVDFFDADDNFDFLVAHHLTRTPLDCGAQFFVTFEDLADDFSTMTYGDIPADVQSRLASFSDRMGEL